MNTFHKRATLFLIGCIGARSLLAYIAKITTPQWLTIMGYIALAPVLGWIYIILTGSRQSGPEVFGDKIWWGDLRIIHATLYSLFAYFAINKDPGAWRFLAADVVFGLLAFLWHHRVRLFS